MPRWVFPLVLLAALLAPAETLAWTYGDTLTTIMKPLPNLPAFVLPGGTVRIWANAPSTATGFSASLKFGSLTTPLAAAGGGWQATLGRWVLDFAVPAGVPEEIYDLSVSCDVCGSDVSRHSVKVIPAFKSSFIFAQISDTHLPSHSFSSDAGFSTADTTGMADFDAVIDDLNLIHPEFVLHTGDIVNEGELEEYLGMYEMGRALGMLSRLRDPVFLVSGNHDQGGWDPTPPPVGTARLNWWRNFGWRFLAHPPAGEHHSQDFSFDYGLLHVIGLEAYINNGLYDDYETGTWGAQSFTPEQMSWLSGDIAAVPAGHSKLAFYHYDFGGGPGGAPGAAFSQINPAALGLDGVIWGHNHGVGEDQITPRSARPFNLGLQSVIDRRAFRIFRVVNGVITPGPRHHSGGTSFAPTDSLTTTWSGFNDGTQSRLTASVLNRFGEAWDHARIVFNLAYHDSNYTASGGTIDRVIRQGALASVYVDCAVPASGSKTVTVSPSQPASVEPPTSPAAFALDAPRPNPFVPESGELALRFALPAAGHVRLAVYDLSGRTVATLIDGVVPAGPQTAFWSGRSNAGDRVRGGMYVVRIESAAGKKRQKISVVP